MHKEDEEFFVITTDQTIIKIETIKLEFCDASLSNFIGEEQIDSTPLIQFFKKDLVLTLESYDNKAEPGKKLTGENEKLLKSFNEYIGSRIICTQHDTKAFMNLAASFKFNATYFN